jgi:ATP-dependent protease Clp ATPase subunit
VYICNECIDRVHTVLATPGQAASTPVGAIAQVSDADRTERCSFCGKRRYRVTSMASTAGAQICNECISLCDEIITEELG